MLRTLSPLCPGGGLCVREGRTRWGGSTQEGEGWGSVFRLQVASGRGICGPGWPPGPLSQSVAGPAEGLRRSSALEEGRQGPGA